MAQILDGVFSNGIFRYAFRFGLGSDQIQTVVPLGLSTEERLLPEFLKEAGYNTHAIGKWHLGFCKVN